MDVQQLVNTENYGYLLTKIYTHIQLDGSIYNYDIASTNLPDLQTTIEEIDKTLKFDSNHHPEYFIYTHSGDKCIWSMKTRLVHTTLIVTVASPDRWFISDF